MVCTPRVIYREMFLVDMITDGRFRAQKCDTYGGDRICVSRWGGPLTHYYKAIVSHLPGALFTEKSSISSDSFVGRQKTF